MLKVKILLNLLTLLKNEIQEIRFRPKMETIWIELALRLSSRSTCSRLKVGSVITDKNLEKVYSVGYNGGAKGQSNECESTKPGQCGHIHSEINALIKCSTPDKEKTLFVTTLPCNVCAKAIVNSGFIKVYYSKEWRDNSAFKIFKKANIKYEQI